MLTIKVLGSGCANCKKLEALTRRVIAKQSFEAELIHVTEYPDIMKYNVMSTPRTGGERKSRFIRAYSQRSGNHPIPDHRPGGLGLLWLHPSGFPVSGKPH